MLRQIFARNIPAVAAAAFVLLMFCAAILSYFWLPYNPNQTVSNDFWALPSHAHLLGLDGSGRDVFARLLAGSRVTVTVSLIVALGSCALSILLAALTVFGSQLFQNSWSVLVDVLIAFPTLLVAIMLATVWGGGLPVVLTALIIGFGVSLSRVVRGEFATVKELDFVTAARVGGVSLPLIFWRHCVRYAAPVLLVQLSLAAALAPLAESSLSYLGFGVNPDTVSHGLMLAQSQNSGSFWHIFVPAVTLALYALSMFTLGDALRTANDPRLSGLQPSKTHKIKHQKQAPTQILTARPQLSAQHKHTTKTVNSALLSVTNLSVFNAQQPLLSNINIDLNPGSSLGIIGASGSGKTITALALGQLLPPGLQATGSIKLHSTETLELPEAARAKLRGAKIAYIFQEPKTALDPLQKIWRQIIAPLRAHYKISRAQLRQEALQLASLVDLEPQLLDCYPQELSGGQRQRVMIAAALAADAQLIIADEITSALDPLVGAQIVSLLHRLVQERNLAMIFISHDLAQVRDLVTEIAVLHRGQIVEHAPSSQIFTNPAHPVTVQLLAAAEVKNSNV